MLNSLFALGAMLGLSKLQTLVTFLGTALVGGYIVSHDNGVKADIRINDGSTTKNVEISLSSSQLNEIKRMLK